MHEPLIAQAALPAQTAICGIPLRPYSLGHELFLIREKSPFVFGGEALPGDLLEAIWICSSTFEECRRATGSLLYLPKLWLLKRRVGKCNLIAESAAFREYRALGSLEFPLSEVAKPDSGPSPRAPGAPFILRLHQFMVTHCRLSICDAWDFPVGEAKMRWATHWEQEGGLEIYNEQEASFDAFVARREAEKGVKPCPA